MKPENVKPRDGNCWRVRRQLAAMVFNKSTSRRVPMTMRMLVPAAESTDFGPAVPGPVHGKELLEQLQALDDAAIASGVTPPEGTRLLKLVPPRWNEEEQMFQLSYEGRACCMSNKNVQLADVAQPEFAALQIGKLRQVRNI